LLMSLATWKEVEEYLGRRRDIIIPVGSVEEHGYHLPLFTDSIIAEEISKEVGERTGIMVAPVVGYGVCRHTSPYPGTVSIELETLRDLVRDVLNDLHKKGFETFYLLTGHAGATHAVALREAGKQLVEKGAEVYLIDPYEVKIDDLLESKLEFPGYQVGHADEVETSLMLFLRPDLVRMEKAVDEIPEEEIFGVVPKSKPTSSGVFGTPTLASREKGERIFHRMVREIVSFIASRVQRPDF
jgi:creatinine amidohydrolase